MTNLNRRNFLKAAGITGAVGAAAAATAVAVPTVAKADYESPATWGVNLAITYLDTPSYNLDPYEGAENLERFDYNLAAFSNATLNAASFGGIGWRPTLLVNQKEFALAARLGYSVRDKAFDDATSMCWGASMFHTWEPAVTAFDGDLGKWNTTDAENSLGIKKAAYYLGSGATGICELNTQWIYSNYQGAVNITDDESPSILEDGTRQIPSTINRAIVMLVPLDGEVNKFSTSILGNCAPNFGYSLMSEIAGKMAKFIRSMGYNAISCGNDTTLSIPLAIDAGLGELGRHGLLINPEYGSNLRICKVLTDMPLEVDRPITFGAARFCKTCGKCAEACPSKSISFEEEPSYDTLNESNNPGMKKWYVNTQTCLEYWVTEGAYCGSCMHVCTYSKPQTWVHDVIKVTAAKTSIFNSIFATMDDAFGYGTTIDAGTTTQADYDEWWYGSDSRNFNITKM